MGRDTDSGSQVSSRPPRLRRLLHECDSVLNDEGIDPTA